MINETITEIVELVNSIYNLEFDLSNNECYDELITLTHEVWETDHAQLLKALDELDPDSNIDFQLFWYDCLGFPKETPKSYYKNGLPSYVFYGFIPSKIHTSVESIGGFHDLNINHAEFLDNNLVLYLDNRCWGVRSTTKWQVKLTFKNVSYLLKHNYSDSSINEFSDLKVEDLIAKNILSSNELPMIPYIFRSLQIEERFLISNKRLFWLSVSDDDDFDIYISFDDWEYSCF